MSDKELWELISIISEGQDSEQRRQVEQYITDLQKEIDQLNNKINSIFSNFEQFINSYKNDSLDDFFIGLRLSEVVEFYNDLKEVKKNE